MRFFVAAAAFASVALAQTSGFVAINTPASYEEVEACSTYNVVLTPSAIEAYQQGNIYFTLIGGATQATLVELQSAFATIPATSTSLSWSVPCDEGAKAIYGLKVFLANDPSVYQYSMPFTIKAKSGGSSSSSSSVAPTSASTSSGDSTVKTTTPPVSSSTSAIYTTHGASSSIITHIGSNTTISTPTSPKTTLTSTTTAGSTGAAASTTKATTAGAARVGGSFAVLAGVAAAMLAL